MTKSKKNNKVILGLSGGVDSTAAALLLQEKGYEVTGLYFDIHPEGSQPQSGSDAVSARERACRAAEQLGIEFIYKNAAYDFEKKVISDFCREYACGRTPNPCVVCNPSVKFAALLEAADQIGAYYIATGHYADTYYDEEAELWYIKKAANEKKDQSYMLYRLGQEAISRLLMPLNHMEDKENVRQIAREKAMVNSEAKDSQEICFIEEGDSYKEFLRRRGVTAPEGDFVDADGNVLGRHRGILDYTIGQRKGLGIALGKPAFVTAIDREKNQVVLGGNRELFHREVVSSGNILQGKLLSQCQGQGLIGFNDITAKIRYAAKPAKARLELMQDGRLKTIFDEPQRAATPGQSIVFYDGDLVLGGGFIDVM